MGEQGDHRCRCCCRRTWRGRGGRARSGWGSGGRRDCGHSDRCREAGTLGPTVARSCGVKAPAPMDDSRNEDLPVQRRLIDPWVQKGDLKPMSPLHFLASSKKSRDSDTCGGLGSRAHLPLHSRPAVSRKTPRGRRAPGGRGRRRRIERCGGRSRGTKPPGAATGKGRGARERAASRTHPLVRPQRRARPGWGGLRRNVSRPIAVEEWSWHSGGRSRVVRVEIGAPERVQHGAKEEWCCEVKVGQFTGRAVRIYGVLPLDALWNALRFVELVTKHARFTKCRGVRVAKSKRGV